MGPINEADLDWLELDRGTTGFRRKKLAAAAGGDRIGCSLYELPPGDRSWPYHYHEGNEEALYVLAGRGRLRLAGETYPLVPGDYVALPAGEDGAHRVVNDGGAAADADGPGEDGDRTDGEGGRVESGDDRMEGGGDRRTPDGEPLRYLAVSTMTEPDVLVYPDSEKVGAMAGAPPGGESERSVEAFFRRADAVGYWDGEE